MSAFISGKYIVVVVVDKYLNLFAFIPFPDELNLFASILGRMGESKPRVNWQKLNQG